METRKEKIIKQLKDRFGDLSCISIEKVADAILAIPLDVMSEEEIEKKYSRSPNNHLHPDRFRKEGAVWAIEQVIKMNQK